MIHKGIGVLRENGKWGNEFLSNIKGKSPNLRGAQSTPDKNLRFGGLDNQKGDYGEVAGRGTWEKNRRRSGLNFTGTWMTAGRNVLSAREKLNPPPPQELHVYQQSRT